MTDATKERLEKGWAALPAEYRPPAQKPSLAEARAYCKRLAETHYENFHVASWFLPERLRPHFHSIYAYCRIADDLGDEVRDSLTSLALLDWWGAELDACYRGQTLHPVFVALAETIRECDIPKQPFADLLIAFRQDQTVMRYETIEDVLGYCRNSANPVGRLVLYACGYRDAERFELSDATCTGLQLANFWQDIVRDFEKGRVYLPQADMRRSGVTDADIAGNRFSDRFRSLMEYEVGIARGWLQRGLPLIQRVDRELALDLDLFSRGGLEILRAIERQDYDVLQRRPVIGKSRKLGLVSAALLGKLKATVLPKRAIA